MGPYQAHKPDTDSYPAQGPDTFSYQPKKPDLNPNLAQGTDMGLISLNCRIRILFKHIRINGYGLGFASLILIEIMMVRCHGQFVIVFLRCSYEFLFSSYSWYILTY